MQVEDRTIPEPKAEPSEVMLRDCQWYQIDPDSFIVRGDPGMQCVRFRNGGVLMEVFLCDTYGIRYRDL